MPKIKVSQRLLDAYPSAKFAGILTENFPNPPYSQFLEAEKGAICNKIRSLPDIKNLGKIREHRAFHEKFGKSYPIEFQLNSIREGKQIPAQSTLKDVLFIAEMKHYCIISGHDVSALGSELQFDISSGNERYTTISGKPQAIKQGDIVLKDNGNVITSLLYGPGSSTKITDSTSNCLYLFWFSSAIAKPELDEIIADFRKSLLEISGNGSKVHEVPISISSAQSQVVTPWVVRGEIDYDKLIMDFGVKPIDGKMLKRLSRQTNGLHYFLKRKIFFAHTYFDTILEQHEKGHKIYLYTGRAPSGPVHLGHLVPWIFCKWLQDKFGATLLFQIPDEEKFLFNEGLTFEDTAKWAHENILDIIAVGFDPKKTMIFLDTEAAGLMYKHACRVAKKVTFSTVKSAFGFNDSNNIGQIFYTCMQSVPAFLPSIMEKKPTHCLIPCAIDQQPHFFMTNDVAPKLGYPKAATILSRFLPGLQGMHSEGKMSSSAQNTSIYTHDNPETVRKKIMKYAFSGGRETLEEHRKLGGNPDIDIPYQYLLHFLEDDEKLSRIYNDYKSGKMLSGEIKQIAADTINAFLREHQKRREKAKKLVGKFMLTTEKSVKFK